MASLPNLPITAVLTDIEAALGAHPNVVLSAPPGAGKTTLVPLALRAAPWLGGRAIVMLEPRRLAARAAAMRMAELLGERVGETVGYRVRFDTCVSRRTRIEVVTEGVLTRRLQNDPALEGVGLLVFDEFHERHLEGDLALALGLDVQQGLRPDLKLLVMSATLDIAPLLKLLPAARAVHSEGRSFSVGIHYAAADVPTAALAQATAERTRQALAAHAGDVLVFLPGAGEIRRAQEALGHIANTVVCPLYGDLPKAAQDAAIRPDARGRRKIVLATPIAESSLTIDGVTVVIDSGFRRAPRFDAERGLSRLDTVRIAQDAAAQRAGRAGRTQPGTCYRLWTRETQRGMPPRTAPEMLSADLAPLVLELAVWGVAPDTLRWLDAPPPPAVAQAQRLLQDLGALDGVHATAQGRAMAALPVHPRLARMLIQAQSLGLGALGCDIAALLSERDVWRGAERNADLHARVLALVDGAKDMDPIARVAAQLRTLLSIEAHGRAAPTAHKVGALLAFAYPDRIASAREANSGRYRLSNGRGASLRAHNALAREAYLVVAALDAAEGDAAIRLAAPVRLDDLRQHFAARIGVSSDVAWDAASQSVTAQQEERLGAAVLSRKPLAAPEADAVKAALVAGLQAAGIDALPWTDEARQWQARVTCLRAWDPSGEWPDVSDAVLLQDLTWLSGALDGVTRLAQLRRLDLLALLAARLDWPQRQRLDTLAPTHLAVPSGSRIRLQYGVGAAPVLAVKLQELFGLAATPRIVDGRVPVVLHLLSPAQRPIQVTQDLAGFWERTYPEVKKELKGRYPKHPWPDDPRSAPPTARAKPRKA